MNIIIVSINYIYKGKRKWVRIEGVGPYSGPNPFEFACTQRQKT